MKKSDAVTALAALAQDNRLDVFRLLVEAGPEGMPAGEVATARKIAPNTLTFHFDRLREAGLVNVRRNGRSMIYAARFETMNALLAYLTEKYPEHTFSIIMGSDGFENLDKWKNPETIIKNHQIIIYKRPGFEVHNKLNANITIMDAPLLEISSTHIRDLVKSGKSIKYLVPPSVEEEILASGLYKKLQRK